MNKRLTVLIAGMLVVTSLLTVGCGKKDTATSGKESKSQKSNLNSKGLPIVKEKVTLKFMVLKDPRHSDFNDLQFFKELEQKTNVHIEWEQVDGSSYGEKKNIVLASGDYPDGFFGTFSLDGNDIAQYGPEGVFIPLNKLIDEYAPRIKDAYAQKPIFKKVSTHMDGNIYSIGSAPENEAEYNPDQMFIYKPWLDKLNLPVPTTVDEFYNTLKAFKEKDPNGNGKADEIPFSFRNGNGIQGIGSLYGMFGRVDPSAHLLIEDGKVVFTADKPEYKEGIKYFNKMFKEGLFDKESFTQDVKQYFAKGKTKDVTLGCFMLWSAQNMTGPERAADYVLVPPLKGSTGKQMWTKDNGKLGAIMPYGLTLTKSCKNPEVAIRWVDEFFDKKTSAEAFYGSVGKCLKEGANGKLEYAEVPKGMSFDEFRYKNAPIYAPGAIFAEDFGKVIEVNPQNKEKIDIMNKYYKPYMKGETLPPLKYDKEESQVLNTISNDINNYVKDYQSKWLLEGGIDEQWDAYLAKLKALKLDEYVKLVQKSYDRFNK